MRIAGWRPACVQNLYCSWSWKLVVKKIFSILCFVALSVCLQSGHAADVEVREPKPYQMPRTHVAPIEDAKSDRRYELYIKLPEGYSENTDTNYPVIYTTDAAWHMDMLSGATEYLMPDAILVGISWQKGLDDERAHVSRFRDYTVTPFNNPEHQAQYHGGKADAHLDFIRNDVFSYIESNFRVDPGERTYFGYSLGGQFGAYALLAQPRAFKNYILGSPALGQRSAEYLDELEAKMAPRQDSVNANVFVSIGELEKDRVDQVQDLVSVLRRRSEAGVSLTGLEIIEDSDHGAAFPETAIRSIKWLSQLNDDG